MSNSIFFVALGYIIPSFLLAVPWHLKLFKPTYDKLKIYRADVSIPLGLLSMAIQGLVFAYLYTTLFSPTPWVSNGLCFAFIGGAIMWSYMVSAVAAKHPMTDIKKFVLLETCWTIVQWLTAGLFMAYIYSWIGT